MTLAALRWRLAAIGGLLLSTGCLDACATRSISDVPERDDSPVQTDSVVYHLQRRASEYRAEVIATYTNRTGTRVYFARCNGESTTPMFGVRRTGADSTRTFFSDLAWACVGGVPTGEIPAGGSLTVRVSVGSLDQPAMQPPLKPEHLVGLLRVDLRLCKRYSADSDYCDSVPDAQRSSNAFLVTY